MANFKNKILSPKKLSAVLILAFAFAGCSGSTSPKNLSVVPGAGTGAGAGGKGPSPVALGQAGQYVLLAQSAISTVPSSSITGNVGISPAAASFLTGFSLSTPPTTFSTSSQVTGQLFAADYSAPTPANLTTAITNIGTAYTDAAARPPDYTELQTGLIGGMNLPPGTYKWSSGVLISSTLFLTGGPNDVWIFQIAGNLTMASSAQIILASGALAKNIFWQTAGATEIGTTAHFEGILLSQTAITLKTGATMNGRLMAQTAIALDQNTISQPQ